MDNTDNDSLVYVGMEDIESNTGVISPKVSDKQTILEVQVPTYSMKIIFFMEDYDHI